MSQFSSNSPAPSVSPTAGSSQLTVPETSTISPFPAAVNNPLIGALASPRTGELAEATQYRKYASAVTSQLTVAGNTDTTIKSIVYEVGRVAPSVGQALRRSTRATTDIDSSYSTASILCQDFSGMAKKYSNFTGSFERSNLAGIVERVAKTLAACSVYPQVSTTDMRAGNNINLQALNTLDTPITSSRDMIFIPRNVSTIMSSHVFSVLVHAAAGEGASVVSDVVNVDANNRTPIVHSVSGSDLATACVESLRVLGANMAASNVNDLFVLALTRGIHRVLSVVAHTDEGGLFRDLMRATDFSTPYGGIHFGLAPVVGLPALNATTTTAIAGYVDSIALTTAALVAHCDPGVVFNNVWYPTTLVGAPATAPETEPGTQLAGTEAMALANHNQLLGVINSFGALYLPALCRLFGLAPSDEHASRVLAAQATYSSPSSRHLQFPSINPFFWVEPTSLIPADFTGYAAEREGFAAYVTKGHSASYPAFEQIKQHGTTMGNCANYIVRARSARTAHLISHFNGHISGALANIKLVQADPMAIVHPGPCQDHETVRERITANLSFDNLLWTRGQSKLCAPGEAINLAHNYGLRVDHLTFDDIGLPSGTGLPLPNGEFLNSRVTYTVSTPVGIASGALGAETRSAQRARTRAVRELAAAVLRRNLFGVANVDAMPTMLSAPRLDSPPMSPTTITRPGEASSLGTSEPTRADVEAGRPDETGAAGVTRPLNPVYQNRTHTAPAINLMGTVQTGTGANMAEEQVIRITPSTDNVGRTNEGVAAIVDTAVPAPAPTTAAPTHHTDAALTGEGAAHTQ